MIKAVPVPPDSEGSPAARCAPFEVTEPALPDRVPAVRSRLSEWLAQRGVDRGLAADIALCASEAMTNSAEHAYRGVEPGDMVVRLQIDAEHLVLSVVDHGTWKAPGDGIGSSHGWGIPLIRSLAAGVDVLRRPGSTALVARFLR